MSVQRTHRRENSELRCAPRINAVRKTQLGIIALLMTFVVAGCKSRNQPAESSSHATSNAPPKSASAPLAANNVTNQWLGRWTGPEGTYLALSKNGDEYLVEIHSLDEAATYDGTSAGDHIEFQRNGKTESIHAGNGLATGMKWLLDKKNCLIIRTGEGFCRD